MNGVPKYQTGEFGKYVGSLSMSFSPGYRHVDEYRLIPVDDSIIGDEHINQLIMDSVRISISIYLNLSEWIIQNR